MLEELLAKIRQDIFYFNDYIEQSYVEEGWDDKEIRKRLLQPEKDELFKERYAHDDDEGINEYLSWVYDVIGEVNRIFLSVSSEKKYGFDIKAFFKMATWPANIDYVLFHVLDVKGIAEQFRIGKIGKGR